MMRGYLPAFLFNVSISRAGRLFTPFNFPASGTVIKFPKAVDSHLLVTEVKTKIPDKPDLAITKSLSENLDIGTAVRDQTTNKMK